MSTSDRKTAQMQLVAEINEATGRLYQAYTDIFPLHEEFWTGLTMEQGDRAGTILDLVRNVSNGAAEFYRDDVRAGEAEKLLARLNNEIKTAKTGKISFSEALETALDIEKTLSGQRFFNMFGGNTKNTREILDYLEESSADRVNILRIELSHHHKE
jgi:hypothetical protein